MKYFEVIDNPYNDNFFVRVKEGEAHDFFYEGYHKHGGTFSYHIAGARVLGLNYADYLRLLRDQYHADIQGKVGYPIPVFKNKRDAEKVCSLLDRYWLNGMKKL